MIKRNYRYSIDCDTIGSTDCNRHGCRDEGICRCYRIERIKINSVDILSIANDIFSQIYDVKTKQYKRDNKLSQILYGHTKEVDLYCIDRLLRIYKVYNPDNWEATWESGYYGDELDSINLNSNICNMISEKIDQLISLSTLKDKIEFILIEEYGYLLDKIKDKEYQILTIDKNSVLFNQDVYRSKVERGEQEEYYDDKKYDLIKGICLNKDDKWIVIDGYHRLTKSKKKSVKIIGIK